MFKKIAQRCKSSPEWFYVFKLHLAINDMGEVLDFCLTSGNTNDRNPHSMNSLTKNIFGKLFADIGYVSQKLAGNPYEKDIQLITKQKTNAKEKKNLELSNKILLRKHTVI